MASDHRSARLKTKAEILWQEKETARRRNGGPCLVTDLTAPVVSQIAALSFQLVFALA